MIQAVDKTQPIPLAEQVSRGLINAIRDGKFQPGKRLPGERVLAKQFGTSRGTIIEALNILEHQNYIERLSTKGTFVTDDVNHELKAVRLVFPFPEPEISLDQLSTLEMWGASSEVYRGIIAEASINNGEVVFQHFEESENELTLARQIRRLSNFDGGVFFGSQLRPLMQATHASGKACVLIAGRPLFTHGIPDFSTVGDDLMPAVTELFEHIKQRNYKRLRILMLADKFNNKSPKFTQQAKENNQVKIDIMLNSARQVGLEATEELIYQVNTPILEWIEQFVKESAINLEDGSELLYCMDTETVSAFYQYAAINNIKIGTGVGIFGLASGFTFHNLFPPLTYIRLPHYERGRIACKTLIDEIVHGKQDIFHETVPAELQIKEST